MSPANEHNEEWMIKVEIQSKGNSAIWKLGTTERSEKHRYMLKLKNKYLSSSSYVLSKVIDYWEQKVHCPVRFIANQERKCIMTEK